ncbi:cytochrome c-type biogenesis CcmF C-terminal domain-containing protein [Luedemannella flava]
MADRHRSAAPLVAGRATPALRTWSVCLACVSFLLVLVGTFLTRSGAVASVHAFTASPLGPMLLGFVLLAVAVVVGLVAYRAGAPGGPTTSPLLSRESVLTGNAVLLVTVASIVLTGTLFPLLARAVRGEQLAVGPDYYARSAVPVGLVVLLLMGLARTLRPGRPADLSAVRLPALVGLATALVVGMTSRPGVLPLLAFGLGAFVLTGLFTRGPAAGGRDRRAGWLLAHAGLAIVAIGVAASAAYTVSSERQLRIGDTVRAGGVTARLDSVDGPGTPGTTGARVTLTLGGHASGTSHPRLRYYPARDLTVSVPAIRSRPTGDVYITVLAVGDDGTTTVRLAVNPLVGLIWLGGALIAAGGLLTIVRRSRAGRPEDVRPDRVGAGSTA